MNTFETRDRIRSKIRRRPSWWLRRRERQIIAIRPSPSTEQLAELGAIRRELRIRSVRPAPLRWWLT